MDTQNQHIFKAFASIQTSIFGTVYLLVQFPRDSFGTRIQTMLPAGPKKRLDKESVSGKLIETKAKFRQYHF